SRQSCLACRVVARREEMTEEFAGEKKNDSSNSGQRCVQKPELGCGHFFEEAADPADEIVARKKPQIINADNRGRQRSGSDPRVKCERNRKDVCESGAVQNMERNEPPDRDLSLRTRGCRPDHERKHTGHSDETANCDLCDLGWLTKFFRPNAPEYDCDEKKTNRDNRIQRDQPRRRHFLSKEDEIRVVLRPDQISVEDLLV